MNIFGIIGSAIIKTKKNLKQRREFKSKNVIVEKGAIVDYKTRFEGNNYLAGELYACDFGFGSYVHRRSVLSHVKVGRFCCISEDVNIRLFEHPINMVSMSPCFYRNDFRYKTYVDENLFDDLHIMESGYTVEIGNDVWIGRGASIRCGVKIGDGAVIGTGAVVTKDVEPYAIVGGVPAKLIKYRFEKDIIDKLLEIKWWDHDEKWLCEHGQEFWDVKSFINSTL